MAYGIDSTGFTLKRLTDIQSEIQDDYRASAEWGPTPNVDPDAALGQEISILSERFSTLWELGQAIYNSFDPDNAEKVSLDRVAAITNHTRLPATYSSVTAIFTGTAGTVITVGSRASVQQTGSLFETLTLITIPIGGEILAVMQAINTGPIRATAGTLINIETPISGWTGITNALDADVGKPIESDPDFRSRRKEDLELMGAATVEAIRSRIGNNVSGVTAVTVIENNTDYVDDEGRPPHSVHCIVSGGLPQDIADELWEAKGAGIQTHGDIDSTVTDSQGYDHLIHHDTPSEVPIWMHITLIVETDFDTGQKQQDTVTVDTRPPDGTNVTVTINGVVYTHTVVFVDTKATIAEGLKDKIQASGALYVAVTATYVTPQELITLTSDYEGNSFTLTVHETLTAARETDASGDQLQIISDVVDYGDANQAIGAPVISDRYYTPVNLTGNILTIDVKISRDAGPAVSGSNITLDGDEIGMIDTSRTTVEIA